MSESKLKIMIAAVRIRMRRGEELENILNSYIALTEDDKEAIRATFA